MTNRAERIAAQQEVNRATYRRYADQLRVTKDAARRANLLSHLRTYRGLIAYLKAAA